jgi:hypothetical protein
MNDGQGTEPVDVALDDTAPERARAADAVAKDGVRDGQDPGLDRPTQGRIGDQLRAMYDGLLNQPVPDRFVDLLKKLDSDGSA